MVLMSMSVEWEGGEGAVRGGEEEARRGNEQRRTVRAQVGEEKLANTLVMEIVDLFRGPVVVAIHAHQLVEQRTLFVHGGKKL